MQLKKRCPRCGWEMVKRKNKENGSEFLGCTQWPTCQHTEPIPEDVRMQMLGQDVAPRLEGF